MDLQVLKYSHIHFNYFVYFFFHHRFDSFSNQNIKNEEQIEINEVVPDTVNLSAE